MLCTVCYKNEAVEKTISGALCHDCMVKLASQDSPETLAGMHQDMADRAIETAQNWLKKSTHGLSNLESKAIAHYEHEHNQEYGRVITKDDLTNLKITLGTASTVEELLRVL